MGKAMSNKIKSKADIIIKEFKERLDIDFEKNKIFIKKMNLPLSKLTVNLMAGYITRKLKVEKKEQDAMDIIKDKPGTPITKAKDTAIHA